MNHPYASCNSHFQEVTNFLEDLRRYNSHKHQLPHLSPYSSDDGNNTIQPTYQEPIDVDPDPPIAAGPFVKEYEEAAEEYGADKTFMSKFSCNHYAPEHVENLYYLLASKDEWDLASFLLQSNLSMASIDSYLSLNWVSAYHLYCHGCLSIFRVG